MKAFVLDSNSWHFWLANHGEIRIWDDCETDICEYTRAVLKGFGWLLMQGLGIILGITWVGGVFYNVYEIFFEGAKVAPWTLITFSVMLGILIAAAWLSYKEWKDTQPKKEPGFIGLAYTKFKDKTCARIEFKQKAQDE